MFSFKEFSFLTIAMVIECFCLCKIGLRLPDMYSSVFNTIVILFVCLL